MSVFTTNARRARRHTLDIAKRLIDYGFIRQQFISP